LEGGLRNARAKGKKIGRPHVFVDRTKVVALRAEGLSWATIAKQMGVGEGTVYRAVQASAKTPSRRVSVTHCEVAAD
jgi:DNA invertase Pin-like site-specific DNA recombinase